MLEKPRPEAEHGVVEFIVPARMTSLNSAVCDCCRRRKAACEFDDDSFGICEDCLCSDSLSLARNFDHAAAKG